MGSSCNVVLGKPRSYQGRSLHDFGSRGLCNDMVFCHSLKASKFCYQSPVAGFLNKGLFEALGDYWLFLLDPLARASQAVWFSVEILSLLIRWIWKLQYPDLMVWTSNTLFNGLKFERVAQIVVQVPWSCESFQLVPRFVHSGVSNLYDYCSLCLSYKYPKFRFFSPYNNRFSNLPPSSLWTQ